MKTGIPQKWPQAVIFDMDGLILDSERSYCQAWKKAAEALGYRIDDGVYDRFIGLPNAVAEQMLAEYFGPPFPLEDFRRNWNRLWRQSVDQKGIPSKTGFCELILYLERRGIPRAVATSTEEKDALFALQDRVKHFTAIITRDQVPRAKPAPDLYLEAASRLETDPGFCLALEDSEVGLQAARAAGMQVILVPDMISPSPAAQREAWQLFPTLHGVLDFLKQSFLD
jgi:beta-phosphoglucomutase-like phosphatase (HAD superfamily)